MWVFTWIWISVVSSQHFCEFTSLFFFYFFFLFFLLHVLKMLAHFFCLWKGIFIFGFFLSLFFKMPLITLGCFVFHFYLLLFDLLSFKWHITEWKNCLWRLFRLHHCIMLKFWKLRCRFWLFMAPETASCHTLSPGSTEFSQFLLPFTFLLVAFSSYSSGLYVPFFSPFILIQ